MAIAPTMQLCEQKRELPWKTVPLQRVQLHGISWETYERLLAEQENNSSTHFAYDRGTLEIMVLSLRHETLKHLLALLVDILAEEAEIDTFAAGSTTFRRADLEQGFEPDACFYFQNAAQVQGKDQLNLQQDPPPELIIEIDITSLSLNKFPIYAAMQIAEIWRYDGERVTIWELHGDTYRERTASGVLPNVTGPRLTDFLEAGLSMKRTAWLRHVRSWARSEEQ